MIIEIYNKWKWLKVLNEFNHKNDLKGLVPSIGSNHGAYWFVAIEKGDVVGAAGCEPYSENHEYMFLGPCAVAPIARGKGLQRQFIERREQKGLSLGFRTFVTTIKYSNNFSMNSFIKSGYLTFSGNEGDRYVYFRKEV